MWSQSVPDDDGAPPEATEETPDAADATAAPPAADAAPEPNPVHEELAARLQAGGLGSGAVIQTESTFDDLVVRVAPASWRHAAEVAKDALECDYLSFIAGIDWMPAPREGEEDSGDTSSPVQPTETTYGAAGSAGRFQVFAHLQSTARHWGITFKTDVDETDPHIDSWVEVYAGADWHERECWEMYGIVFDGHPALRHLYLPSGFEGHPLRKDFPLLARVVKPWPGLVDVEAMPGEPETAEPETAEPETAEPETAEPETAGAAAGDATDAGDAT
jgi:NADH-quinone oxidoreductase subunit C